MMITKPRVSGKAEDCWRQKLLHSLVLQRSFSNFSMEASYTNCYSNTLEQWVPLLRTLQSEFLMWQYNWIMKILWWSYSVVAEQSPQLLCYSLSFPGQKHILKRILHDPQHNSWVTRVSTPQQILRLSNFILLWSGSPTPNIKPLHKLKNSKIFSFNAIKMFNSTGAKPFF